MTGKIQVVFKGTSKVGLTDAVEVSADKPTVVPVTDLAGNAPRTGQLLAFACSCLAFCK